ncbi:MAG: hypothetical protein ACJ74X_07030, partial [Gaiellaceae bacterium]
MNERGVYVIVLATLAIYGTGSTTAAGGPRHAGKRCPAGFVQVVASGGHLCRSAADLRVSISATPATNRVGGSFTYEVTVRNVGRKPAPRLTLTADAPAELVAVTAATGTCTSSQASVHIACNLGTLKGRSSVGVSIVARALTVGRLRLSVRATS